MQIISLNNYLLHVLYILYLYIFVNIFLNIFCTHHKPQPPVAQLPTKVGSRQTHYVLYSLQPTPKVYYPTNTLFPTLSQRRKAGKPLEIGIRIQFHRVRHGFSQEALADKLNVTRQSVSKWELNQALPDLEKVVQLSQLFNLTTDELILNTPPTQRVPGQPILRWGLYLLVKDFPASVRFYENQPQHRPHHRNHAPPQQLPLFQRNRPGQKRN